MIGYVDLIVPAVIIALATLVVVLVIFADRLQAQRDRRRRSQESALRAAIDIDRITADARSRMIDTVLRARRNRGW